MDPKAWPCSVKDGGCGSNLANVVGGELALVMENVAVINTDGVNLVLTCRKCGKAKTWFAKPQAIIKAHFEIQVREIVNGLAKLSTPK